MFADPGSDEQEGTYLRYVPLPGARACLPRRQSPYLQQMSTRGPLKEFFLAHVTSLTRDLGEGSDDRFLELVSNLFYSPVTSHCPVTSSPRQISPSNKKPRKKVAPIPLLLVPPPDICPPKTLPFQGICVFLLFEKINVCPARQRRGKPALFRHQTDTSHHLLRSFRQETCHTTGTVLLSSAVLCCPAHSTPAHPI